jgi:DNA-binding CsgD family transcriptional regulator
VSDPCPHCPYRPRPPRVVRVTVHQKRVVEALMADGATNAVLARRLGLTIETVRTHMARILRATGCPDRTALVVALARRRIVLTTDKQTGGRPGPPSTRLRGSPASTVPTGCEHSCTEGPRERHQRRPPR